MRLLSHIQTVVLNEMGCDAATLMWHAHNLLITNKGLHEAAQPHTDRRPE